MAMGSLCCTVDVEGKRKSPSRTVLGNVQSVRHLNSQSLSGCGLALPKVHGVGIAGFENSSYEA